jgi:hypothetical protein
VINLFDYKWYFVKENNQCMIVLGKFKHWGVKYNKDKSNLLPRKNEVIGDRELRWSILVIFNNLKVLYKTASAASHNQKSALVPQTPGEVAKLGKYG